ncbi:hypothetical protein DYB32_002962, partial [Aphanomyces invadans]
MSEVFTHGSQASRETYMRLCKLLEAHLSFEDAQKMLSESIENQRVLALRLACLVEKLILMHRLSNTDAEVLRVISQDLTGYATPTLLHHAMFTKNLASIFTPEQVAAWGTPIDSFQWLGCYAQTELGHGSNLRSLETTATFLPDVDEFELHSPTLTSIKYWPGALASTANMAVVYARLLIHGTDHGVHSFLLQLRDFTTHKPLPGITVGHIGNVWIFQRVYSFSLFSSSTTDKLAFNTVDNGYLKLDRVRIPRANMAMKFSTHPLHVSSRADGAKRELSYFTMLQMRFHMVHGSAKTLSKAATIAVRYSAIRLQGLSATAPHGEVRVLDYQSQQHRVLPRVAESFAIFATSTRVDFTATDYEALFRYRFLTLLHQFDATAAAYPSPDVAIQTNLIESHHLALCYGKYVLVHEFAAAVESLSRATKPIAVALFELFCVTQLQEDLGDFMALVQLPTSARASLHARLTHLLDAVRPHAVALVDAFDHSDVSLNSTLGRADGNVYDALMQSSLLYASDAVPGFTEYLQPLRRLH